MIPKYRHSKNTPYITKDEKTSFIDKMQSKPVPKEKERDPLVDLQVYQPETKPSQKKVAPNLWTPITTQNPYNFPKELQNQLTTPYPNAHYAPNNVPVVKNYNISVGGPEVDHIKVSSIFEDMLPMNNIKDTYNSLGERLVLNDYIRSVFIKKNDGEDINLEGGGENCLISYLKFLQLNPNVTKAYSINPYKNLPDNMLIYKSCYPIRYDPNTLSVSCAKNSVGMNIRIYKMTLGEYYVKNKSGINYYDYDLWREIAWYEFVRENIIKRKMCPNFVVFYSYFINENCKIDFDKVSDAKKSNRISSGTTLQGGGDRDTESKVNKDPSDITHIPKRLRDNTLSSNVTQIPARTLNDGIGVNTLSRLEKDPTEYSGKALVALTESPNYNLYEWASKMYELDGNIKRMINTGFHSDKVWYSIIFQIMSSLYALQKHKIAFRNYKIDENIYVKELSYHNNINTYWKYNINGVNFYIPNHGYLVLFDSNFKDKNSSNSIIKNTSEKNKYKIYTNNFGGKPYKEEDINKLCFKAFLNTVNSNNFSDSFVNKGGVRPPDNVLNLLKEIHEKASEESTPIDIGFYIMTYMTMFMNNRIGTYLDEQEANNIRKNDARQFKSGKIVVHETESDSYKFVLYLGDGVIPGKSKIFTKDDNNLKEIIEQEVSSFNLHHYSRFEPITQKFRTGEALLNEENLIESYIM